MSEDTEQWTYLRTPQWNCEVLYHWRKNVEFEISSFGECDRLLRFVSVFNRYSLLLVKIQPKFLLKLCRGVMMIFFGQTCNVWMVFFGRICKHMQMQKNTWMTSSSKGAFCLHHRSKTTLPWVIWSYFLKPNN